jgi:serine protease Do
MELKRSRMRTNAWLIAMTALLRLSAAGAADVAADPVSAELMKSIRAATFEVVLKKVETDPLGYAKPLPWDLLPFAERNDKYRSIGTAFAIARDTFVTAAHVTAAASGSQLGAPALRDAQGNVYPIDRVTRFSMDKDFIVFTVSGAPRISPLPTSTEFQIDTTVIAVGNALGQGIVARGGTLTSETPEEQDGAWKWLRFSAPASPGNSGGPLLDAKGRVIGLIARKSANENLNYALPIALVLNAPANKASLDTRLTVSVPVLTARKTVRIKAGFDLPLRFAEFDSKFMALNDEQFMAAQRLLLQESAADTFPRGKSTRLLADTFLNGNPALIRQQSDGFWDVTRNLAGTNTQLGNDGSIWMGAQGAATFRIRYPSDLDVAKSRGDSKLLAEQLLMAGVTLGRPFGNENVRIISLGTAAKTLEFKDDFGRIWQQWRYPVPYADSTMMIAALPTPEGYVGFWRSSNGASIERTSAEMRLLMNFLQVSYSGTLSQWRSFLADTRLRPETFSKWNAALDPAGEVSIALPRLTVKVDKQVLNLTDKSVLSVIPGTLMDGDRPAWDVLALNFGLEARASASIGILRRAKPADSAGQVPVNRWGDMVQQRGPFAGNPIRNQNGGVGRKVVGADGTAFADATFLYELNYGTTTSVQGEILRAMPHLTEMVRILEK